MTTIEARLDAARKKLAAAEAELEMRRWHPPPVKHDAETKVRTAEARVTELVQELNAQTETQPQLIKRREQELAKAQEVLAKAPPNSSKYDEAEKNVAIAEYRLAQASKPAPAAAAFGGKSRRRRIRKVKQTQRRKAKRTS